ncbi:hypothetical protein [Roseibium sp. SCP14]|uniref:hypothetical protein n=1 Tax=Roseibium sp. SCP14 TaxID=3141375 RepID=UPI00333B4EE1
MRMITTVSAAALTALVGSTTLANADLFVIPFGASDSGSGTGLTLKSGLPFGVGGSQGIFGVPYPGVPPLGVGGSQGIFSLPYPGCYPGSCPLGIPSGTFPWGMQSNPIWGTPTWPVGSLQMRDGGFFLQQMRPPLSIYPMIPGYGVQGGMQPGHSLPTAIQCKINTVGVLAASVQDCEKAGGEVVEAKTPGDCDCEAKAATQE